MHAEIRRLAGRLHSHRELADIAGTVTAEQSSILACLYGLHALLCLHFAQEEEDYFVLARRQKEARISRPQLPVPTPLRKPSARQS